MSDRPLGGEEPTQDTVALVGRVVDYVHRQIVKLRNEAAKVGPEYELGLSSARDMVAMIDDEKLAAALGSLPDALTVTVKLAERAIESMREREGEDVGEWADRLARRVAETPSDVALPDAPQPTPEPDSHAEIESLLTQVDDPQLAHLLRDAIVNLLADDVPPVVVAARALIAKLDADEARTGRMPYVQEAEALRSLLGPTEPKS